MNDFMHTQHNMYNDLCVLWCEYNDIIDYWPLPHDDVIEKVN